MAVPPPTYRFTDWDVELNCVECCQESSIRLVAIKMLSAHRLMK